MILSDDTKNATPELDALLHEGFVALGDVTCTLTRRAGDRLVIAVLQDGDDARWLDEVCAADEFSQLRLTAPSPDSLAGPQLEPLLRGLAKDPGFAGTKVSLCGIRQTCQIVSALARCFTDPTVVMFDPPDAETDADADTIFFDPFTSPVLGKMAPARRLKCFASDGDSAGVLARMALHRTVLPAALQGELDPVHFYALMRKRKDYRFYRVGVEKALEARGKTHLVQHFRDRFRARRVAQSHEIDALQACAAAHRPAKPGEWARLRSGDTGQKPSAPGNVWMLQFEAGKLRYLSDRWQGVTMGYVEQDGVTLAETPATAIGIAAFGDGQQVERPLARRFPWHVVDAQLDGTAPAFGPATEASLSLEQLSAERAGLVTAVALGVVQPGITAAEAVPGAARYQAMIAQIETACTNLAAWDKALDIDRLRLSLLTGAPATPETDAARHYSEVARALTRDIASVTAQAIPPSVVVVPQAGLRHDGTSEIALAEARFDLDNPTLSAVIPTPAYPFPLMADMPATHTPKAALLIDELCMLALRERQNGRPWHCPQLQIAQVSGPTITAQFSTMDGLVLEDDAPHGFSLVGSDAPAITRVEVTSDTEVTLHLDAAVTQPGLSFTYAWGHKTDRSDGTHAANHGALRDRWEKQSTALDGHRLHRFALPARIPLHVRH